MLNGLKKLKRETKPRHKQCQHNWCFAHSIYAMNDADGLAIHRQCSKCGIHELCKIPQPRWTRSIGGFDLPNLRS